MKGTSMQNIQALSDYIKEYAQQKFNEFYDLDFWRRAAIAESKQINSTEILEIFDVFGARFKPILATTQLKASANAWDACCNVIYQFKLKNTNIDVSIMLAAGDIIFVNIKDMYRVQKSYDADFDFVKEFEKLVLIPNALTGK